MAVPGRTASRNHSTHSSGMPRSTTFAVAAPAPAPMAIPATHPTGPPRISPSRPADTAPDIADGSGCGSTVSRTVVRPSSSLTTVTASSSFSDPLAASRVAAVRNSWARNTSGKEMPTNVCGPSSSR